MPVAVALPALAGLALLLLALVFHRLFAKLLGLAARTLAALGGLALWRVIGAASGIALGVNLANALTLALLGLPGFALLLMLNWLGKL